MTVGELLERMTSAELTEWAAYFEVQAFRRDFKQAQQDQVVR